MYRIRCFSACKRGFSSISCLRRYAQKELQQDTPKPSGNSEQELIQNSGPLAALKSRPPARSRQAVRRTDFRNIPRPETLEKDLPYFKFEDLLRRRLTYLEYGSSAFKGILSELGLSTGSKKLTRNFTSLTLTQPASTYADLPKSGREARAWRARPDIPTLDKLKSAYELEGLKGMDDLIVSKFSLFASMHMLSPEDLEAQKKLADMTRPAEWYPVARSVPRKLHLHVGPTNSGKTYHALQRLQKAQSGCFAGPLRLLAFEIWDRFNKANVPCNLLTGEERRIEPDVRLTSSTIEMLNMSEEIDVLVIDEIQMIADPERGPAWTQALLGCPAREIHMCGEASVVELVQKIAATLGETVEVHEYTRLGALQPLTESLGGTFKDIQEGDAVVTFSRQNIFDVKKSIEQTTGKKCAVVYGGLPPETRASQAKLFNDPDSGYDVMVASDAIGMGLNLSIKRVIFESVEKWNGKEIQKVPVPQVKQIAGRAGRFKPKQKVDVNESDPPKEVPGYVTTLRPGDIQYLHESLATPTIQLQKAVLRPPLELVEAFSRPYPQKIRISMVMQQLQALATTSDLYELKNPTSGNSVFDLLHPIKGLSFGDRWCILDAPLKNRDPKCVRGYLEMATALGEGRRAEILDMEEIDIDLLDKGVPQSQEHLAKIESLHHQLTMYLWLSLRFPGVFTSLSEVYQLKLATEELIQDGLELLKAKRKAGSQGGSGQFINQQMAFDLRKKKMHANFSRRSQRAGRDDPEDDEPRHREYRKR
ncbi:putative Mitochondrial ATP-dependent RNA helicase Suv3 [Taphrina deformans PYCC 5710]|uniref:RNA helicase n=1 Tax=Taphrina deformans (strain PYCC 5710 / ATCC 11124 / CBS 356.35 / IMI 108563 / JCM 9778 / NBRC 8474) TaxID=1097556 RepID=R4X7A4_TAPDE|nr:putative Mitochondrial ATP-dependent RNA helicase Suv3 [Taphrina deformans PYCC 5710]|eukprot:CCG81186.1 putative Mitochondrial ATP-dependent RNA helicase Suv3 [Taphrina deformans PYCC 5710]